MKNSKSPQYKAFFLILHWLLAKEGGSYISIRYSLADVLLITEWSWVQISELCLILITHCGVDNLKIFHLLTISCIWIRNTLGVGRVGECYFMLLAPHRYLPVSAHSEIRSITEIGFWIVFSPLHPEISMTRFWHVINPNIMETTWEFLELPVTFLKFIQFKSIRSFYFQTCATGINVSNRLHITYSTF